MSLVVTPIMTNISLAESATGWSVGALDPDFFKQGSNSLGFYMSKNARGSITYTPAASIAWSSYTYPHLYFWMNSSVAAKMTNKSTGTTTASGVTVRVTLSSGAYREWHVTGADKWDGGWDKCFVVDMAHTGTQLYASSGTFSSASNIASVTWYFDLSSSGNIRNVPANCWLDAIRVGEGLRVHNTSAADATFDFADIAAVDENVSNQYGVLRTLFVGAKGAFGSAGRLEIGDAAGSNHCDFDSQDETVVFLERDGSGYGLVNSNLYELKFVGNATGTDQDVSVGVKVGTGDTATARNGSQIRAGGTTVRYTVNWNDSDLHNVTLYGLTLQGAFRSTGTIGVQAGTPVTLHEVIGCTLDSCGEADFQDATCRNVIVLNSAETGTTYGAVLWDETDSDMKNCLFVNNTNAIEVRTLTAAMSFDGMSFSGNTYDVRYEDTGSYNLNWTNAAGAPSIQNASTGVLTAVNTVTLTLTNVVVGSQCSIVADAGGYETEGTVLMNEAAISSTVTENYAYVSSQPVIIRVRKASAATKYRNYVATGVITGNFTLRVDQIPDGIVV